MVNESTCRLCWEREGTERKGRMGRYAHTCDQCESRRGSHLAMTAHGYDNAEASMAS